MEREGDSSGCGDLSGKRCHCFKLHRQKRLRAHPIQNTKSSEEVQNISRLASANKKQSDREILHSQTWKKTKCLRNLLWRSMRQEMKMDVGVTFAK
ncbi:hypothetical protein QQF64_018475 [Cirrhinus molitorella]|uniref:Uncharacterized protein n=1 Tax=Cirrhinus molitorella TaxID=172907 RepID=A0ABR3LG54_9TELE